MRFRLLKAIQAGLSGQAGLMTNAGLSGLAITSGRCGIATLTIVELLARSRF